MTFAELVFLITENPRINLGLFKAKTQRRNGATVLNQQLFINPSEISRNPTTDGDSNFLASTKLNYFFFAS